MIMIVSGPYPYCTSCKAGETLTTLDGNERELNESMLIIADTKGPIGVAGVMGGLTSEVTDKTTKRLVRSCCI